MNIISVLQNTNLAKLFKPDGHYTLFAPTNEAFNKLDENLKQKILKGDACASSILKHHVVAHTVCSSAIIGNATTHNIEGELVEMQRREDDHVFIGDKAKVTQADIIATNGVIHLIDTILIPDSALHITEALKSKNITKFQNLINQAGLTEEIDSLDNATVFAPTDEAFADEEVSKVLDEIKDDKEKLRYLVRYHIVQGQVQSCDLNNNQLLETKMPGDQLRVNLFSTVRRFFF